MNTYAVVITGSGPNMEVLIQEKEEGNSFIGGPFTGDPLENCLKMLKEQTGISMAKDQAYELSIRDNKTTHSYLFYREKLHDPQLSETLKLVPIYMLKEMSKNFGAILCEALGKFWRQMPSFINNFRRVELPSLFVKNHLDFSKDEVIFYGGSFNPWHPGHKACLDVCPTNNIIVVPDYNPWKKTAPIEGRCFWSEYRKLCLKLKDTPYAVYSGFWGLEDPNPTVNWIPNIRAEQKGLLLGDDSFVNILDWKDSEVLITFLKIIYVVPRMHKHDEMEFVKKKVLEIHPNMKVEILAEHEYMQESSTLIREKQFKS